MQNVTLFRADTAKGTDAPCLELVLPLDAEGYVTIPGPHPARLSAGAKATQGECLSEPEAGHFLRFPAGPDAPVLGVFDAGARFRPGDALLLRRTNGGEETWRVVAVR